MQRLVDAGAAKAEPVPFASNAMEIVVERGNPLGIRGVTDLGRSGLVVVLCAATVPCGAAAQAVLSRAGVEVKPASLENKVKSVVTKVAAGEADAGIVFSTDVLAAAGSVSGVEVPDAQNVVTTAPIVATSSNSAAQEFVDFVTSPVAQRILADRGFKAP
jgi:molybdate transport system substrate-binding protein